ncbi:unnamed protein product [Mytilus coruscus]|uniref:Uncharacterized protein n=1 Tax=Mytilus coruscus TaxID=42192 RepID=A0A6J8AMY6_MYTCO|nr:unnamed protein product [Mytilus coruscus]
MDSGNAGNTEELLVSVTREKGDNHCTNDLFLQYLKQELNFEAELNVSEKMYCCSYCYNSFNLFCRSEAGEEAKYQTPQYLIECLNKLTCIDPVDVCADNIDTVTHHIIEFVVKSFLDDKPLLLPVVYEKYMNLLKTNINTFKCTISGNEQLQLLNHNLKWLLRMLKVKLGKGRLHFVPKRKKDGCLIHRNGADLLSALHTMTVNFYSTLNEKNEEVTKLIYNNKKLISEKNTKMTNHEILDEAVQILRTFVKQYTSEKSLLTELPDIKKF